MPADCQEPASRHGSCLLVSANRMTLPYPVYPLGIAYLLGALEARGHQADHLDILASGGHEPLRQLLRQKSYDLIGISIRNIDTVDSASRLDLLDDITSAIAIIRKESTAPVVLGGPGFSIMPGPLLYHCRADYGIVGEGEAALPLLLERLVGGDPPQERLLAMPAASFPSCTPRYSAEVTPYYLEHGGMLNVQSKRGCAYGCSYCSYPTIEGRVLRHRAATLVAAEIGELTKRFGARYIFFTDAIFNDPQGRYLELAEALASAGNRTPWCAFFRPQNIDRKSLRLLKRSGLAAMEIGTDAACDATLTSLGKGFTFDEVAAVHDNILAENIPCAHFVIFGGPGETATTLRQGLHNLQRLRRSVVFAYIGIRILPGTALHRQAVREGHVDEDTDLVTSRYYYSPAISREDIEGAVLADFRGRRDRVYPVADSEKLIPLMHRFGHIGPLWDKLIPATDQ